MNELTLVLCAIPVAGIVLLATVAVRTLGNAAPDSMPELRSPGGAELTPPSPSS